MASRALPYEYLLHYCLGDVGMNKRCAFVITQCVVLAVCSVICGFQTGLTNNTYIPLSNSTFVILPFLLFSFFQYFLQRKEHCWRKIVNGVLSIVKSTFCLYLSWFLIFPAFASTYWQPEFLAEIGNFSATIWFTILHCTTGIFLVLALVPELVLVGMDVVWMVKKLARHIQAKKQKA